MNLFLFILLGFLLACAISVSLSRNLLNSILIYMSYSLVASVIWILLESPDLAITEAAVGAGITSVLFFVTLKKIHAMMDETNEASETDGSLTGLSAGKTEKCRESAELPTAETEKCGESAELSIAETEKNDAPIKVPDNRKEIVAGKMAAGRTEGGKNSEPENSRGTV